MVKDAHKTKRGRPVSHNPKRVLISFRIDEAVADAVVKKRSKMGIRTFSISDTVREIVVQALEADGFLKSKTWRQSRKV